MTDRESQRAEFESLRSEWREALLAAHAALQAEEKLRTEEGALDPGELDAHERRLQAEYATTAEELRRFALEEGLPIELAEPFLPPHPCASSPGASPDGARVCVRAGRRVRRRASHPAAWPLPLDPGRVSDM